MAMTRLRGNGFSHPINFPLIHQNNGIWITCNPGPELQGKLIDNGAPGKGFAEPT